MANTIGKLNKRVSVINQTVGNDDGMGGVEAIGTATVTYWAEVIELSSTRGYKDKTVDYINLTQFKFRNNVSIANQNAYLQYNSIKYTIDSVIMDDTWTIVKAYKQEA